MATAGADYDPRYLAGILFFNRRDFFEAHEVWEDLWADSCGPDHRFYQGLIQAAVALYHFGNGNVRGAFRLFHSSRDYMKKYGECHLGLDLNAFWEQMRACFAEIVSGPEPPPTGRVKEELIPVITLDPAPVTWPDPQTFLAEEEAAE